MEKKKGVVWISTVLYVLIGLAIMASLLAIIRPKISETKDKFVIDQTIQSLNTLDDTILRAREATGTSLNYVIRLDEGSLTIDGAKNTISWQAMSNYQYSEANKTIAIGKIKASTFPYMSIWNVTLILDYTGYNVNLTINGNYNSAKTLMPAGTPYSIWITNNGTRQGAQQIDFSIA